MLKIVLEKNAKQTKTEAWSYKKQRKGVAVCCILFLSQCK